MIILAIRAQWQLCVGSSLFHQFNASKLKQSQIQAWAELSLAQFSPSLLLISLFNTLMKSRQQNLLEAYFGKLIGKNLKRHPEILYFDESSENILKINDCKNYSANIPAMKSRFFTKFILVVLYYPISLRWKFQKGSCFRCWGIWKYIFLII